jgi:hypothetical protein
MTNTIVINMTEKIERIFYFKEKNFFTIQSGDVEIYLNYDVMQDMLDKLKIAVIEGEK